MTILTRRSEQSYSPLPSYSQAAHASAEQRGTRQRRSLTTIVLLSAAGGERFVRSHVVRRRRVYRCAARVGRGSLGAAMPKTAPKLSDTTAPRPSKSRSRLNHVPREPRSHQVTNQTRSGKRTGTRQMASSTSIGPTRSRYGHFDEVTLPSDIDGRQAPGLRFGDRCVMAVLAATVGVTHLMTGFDNRQLTELVATHLDAPYTRRQATYDLRRLRAKDSSNAYRTPTAPSSPRTGTRRCAIHQSPPARPRPRRRLARSQAPSRHRQTLAPSPRRGANSTQHLRTRWPTDSSPHEA